ncbi:hypothetical protein D3C77_669610 [compost metagenome]
MACRLWGQLKQMVITLSFPKNEHGVPQYPKGHTGRLWVVLAAIEKLDRPTAVTIAKLTGLSKGNVDKYVHDIQEGLGVSISKVDHAFSIRSWGVLINPEEVAQCLTVPINRTDTK